jgi:hypothetical protein
MLGDQFPNLTPLAAALRDYSLGTIWWVQEPVWKSVLRSGYESNKKGHPGLSIRNNPIPPYLPMDQVALLHGTSVSCSTGKAFRVKGITRHEPQRQTYFKWNLRGAIPFLEFELEHCYPAEKQKLDDADMTRFRSELQKRGLL